jgi:hypothetical protein
MTNEETNGYEEEVRRIIAEFRSVHAMPCPKDWMMLVAEHPRFADAIADAALSHGAAEHLQEADLDVELDENAYEAGASRALSLVFETPSTVVCEVQENIAAIRGPGVRRLAKEIDLAPYAVPLLHGILAGSIEAPRQILERLSMRFKATTFVLVECFRLTHAEAPMPAHKSTEGKPDVMTQPIAWADAVRSLQLSDRETRALLALEN